MSRARQYQKTKKKQARGLTAWGGAMDKVFTEETKILWEHSKPKTGDDVLPPGEGERDKVITEERFKQYCGTGSLDYDLASRLCMSRLFSFGCGWGARSVQYTQRLRKKGW